MFIYRPMIIAHRGAAGEAPENTLAAFRLALQQGCDAVELDVHVTADGEIVVCHDEAINRTTNGKGAIRDLKVAEIKRFDAGAWFHERFRGERIPLLEEVFELLPPDIMINIEIKMIPAYRGVMETKLLRLLTRKRRLGSIVVSSFDEETLLRLHRLDQAVRLGLLYQSKRGGHRQRAELCGARLYSLHPQHKLIGCMDVADALRHGYAVYPWTVDRPEDMRRQIANGVSGIITNYPGRLREVLGTGRGITPPPGSAQS